MIPILRAQQMKNSDTHTIGTIGIPAPVLMERAAFAIARKAKEAAGECPLILAVCGSGNNGGDGVAAARILAEDGIRTGVVFAGNPERLSPEMELQLRIARNLGIPVYDTENAPEADVLIDALLGIGISRPAEGKIREAIEWINASGAYVVSADIPSGICADTGSVLGCAVKADATVAVQFLKTGLCLYPGAGHAGEVSCAPIGIRAAGDPDAFAFTEEDLRQAIPERDAGGHKGVFGKVAVAAGSRGMSGAAVLCARAVLRSGAGMVRIVTEECNRKILQTAVPEAMVSAYADPAGAEEAFREAASWADTAAVGPGIGRGENAHALVGAALTTQLPLVLDADALTISGNFDLTKKNDLYLTPHIGEMQALTGLRAGEIKADLIGAAAGLSRRTGASVILKDARSVIAQRGKIYINMSGNSGMATAGSGDVLTGTLAALLARGADPAAPAAAYLHGLAGDMAARKIGPSGVMAGDIADHLSAVLMEINR